MKHQTATDMFSRIMFSKVFFSLVIILLLTCAPRAQTLEYGDATELRGRRAWFVYCEDLELRKEILELLQAESKARSLDVDFVDTGARATLVIFYTQWWTGAPRNSTLVSELFAVAPVRNGNAPVRLRILYSTRSQNFWSGDRMLLRPLLVKAVRSFLDEWAARNNGETKPKQKVADA